MWQLAIDGVLLFHLRNIALRLTAILKKSESNANEKIVTHRFSAMPPDTVDQPGNFRRHRCSVRPEPSVETKPERWWRGPDPRRTRSRSAPDTGRRRRRRRQHRSRSCRCRPRGANNRLTINIKPSRQVRPVG